MHSIPLSGLLPFGTSLIVDASWKALLFLLLAAVAAFAAQKSSAAVRHRIWCLSFAALICLPVLEVCVPRWHVALLPAGETPQALMVRGSANPEMTPSDSTRPAKSPSASEISKSDPASQSASEMPSPLEPIGPEMFSTMSPTATVPGPDETRWPIDGIVRMALAALWITVALTLLGRQAVEAAVVRRLVARCRPLGDERWNSLLSDSRARLCMRRSVRLLECDEAIVPVTCGLARPVILLPAASHDWSLERRRFVLLHELAHVKRLDVLFQMVARTACSFYWFNPLAWYALRRLRIERELACDDCVVAAGESAVDYADQLVEIARSCRRSCGASRYAVGIPMARSCNLEERIVALLDRARSHRVLSRPISGLLAFAALVLMTATAALQPVVRAAASNPTDLDQPAEQAVSPDARIAPTKNGTFALTVMGPDGKVVPRIEIEVRSRPRLKTAQILEGQFVRSDEYGVYVKATATARLVLELPKNLTDFNIAIEVPGYGPYWVSWNPASKSESIPTTFTAEIDAAWSVGGVVVDDAGKPVKGAVVSPMVQFKKPPGDVNALYTGGSHVTDANGKWHFDSVPISNPGIYVEINHPDFMSQRSSLSRALFGLEKGQTPGAKIPLKRGVTVTGKITGESGKPIAGAAVRAKFGNDLRKATSGQDGVYHLTGCEPVLSRIVVSAKGRATDMQELSLSPEMKPVDFQLKPGGKIRVRVLDEKGQPVARARIFFQRWRGRFEYFEFDHVSQYADQNGLWQWNEAPLDEFQADICPRDGMNLASRPLVARSQEYVFRLPPPLVITGNVVDRETKQPIKKFRVVPGIRSSPTWMNWARGEAFTAIDGRYRMTQRQDYFAYIVRIEADGYEPAASRDIKSNEGSVTVDFELTKGKDIDAVVLTPDGRPAAKAHIAMGVAGAQIIVSNGDVENDLTYADRQQTDQQGRFHFPPQERGPYLVITHPSGYARFQATLSSNRRIINLDPWTRVEGIYRVGGKPQANIPITILRGDTMLAGDGNRMGRPDPVPHIVTFDDVTTDPNGHFVFERVMAGHGTVGRRLMLTSNDGARDVSSQCRVETKFPLGKTLHLDFPALGRAVVGTLHRPIGDKKKVRWSFAQVEIEPEKTADGTRHQHFTASVAPDGTFRVDDVPAGDCSLNVRFQLGDGGFLINHHFRVPNANATPSAPPLDLGVLTLRLN
jgi:beta-lactamase regulating signal transducer with metallopeptidase domain